MTEVKCLKDKWRHVQFIILLYRISQRMTLWLSFVNPRKGRSSHSQMFLWNRCSEIFLKFHRKKPVLVSLLNKVADLKVCNFIKKRLQHRRFPVKFRKCLRAPFLQNTFGGWFWKETKGTSLVKILQSCLFNIFGINHRCFRKTVIKKSTE